MGIRIAHPVGVIEAEDNATRFDAIARLVAEWQPARFIVGLPLHIDGTEHAVSRLARRFAQRLHGRFGIPFELIDERLTSRAAEARLRDAGTRGRRLAAALDAAAACEILQSWFESRVPPAA